MHGSLQNPGERDGVPLNGSAAPADMAALRPPPSTLAKQMVEIGIERFEAGDPGNARAMFSGVLDHDADNASAWSKLGVMADAHNKHAASIALARRAVVLDPCAGHLADLGIFLWRDAQYREAIGPLRQAFDLEPDDPKHAHHLGLWHYTCNSPRSALSYYDLALAHAPHNLGLQLDHSLAMLASGDLKRGLELHEVRWQILAKSPVWDIGIPRWEGEDLSDKTLIIHHEQGFGDTLCWVRCIPEIKLRWPSVRIVFAAPRPLMPLLVDQCGIDDVIDMDRAGDIVRFGMLAHYHCPLLSLLRVTGKTFESFRAESEAPYLRAPSTPGARRALKGPGCKLAVGVIWSANKGAGSGHRKSVPVELMASLIEVPGVKLYSLQHGATQELVESRCDYAITDLSASFSDFAELAGLMTSLDVVVTVCTGPSHLAGALGVKTLLLNPYTQCWRYCHGVERIHPTMEDFRQSDPRDWSAPIAAVKARLKELAAADQTPL